MGGSSWSTASYSDYTTRNFIGKSVAQTFTRTSKDHRFDPKNVIVRESRDSTAHPESNAIIVALDVTGSLGHMAKTIAEKGLGTLIEGILDTQPVTDPQVCIMAGIVAMIKAMLNLDSQFCKRDFLASCLEQKKVKISV